MKLFGFQRRQKLSASWTYMVDGVIWRLVPTPTGRLIGEERDLPAKRASFFCIDQPTGRVLWQKATVYEQWWVGIEAVHRDLLVLHSYSSPDLPEHKGIIGLDLMSGRQLWVKSEMRFITAVNDSVFATSQGIGTKSIAEIEYRSGSLLQSWEGDEGERKEQELLQKESTDEWFGVPSLVSNPADLSPWITRVLEGGSGARGLVGQLEVLDHNGQVFVLCSHEHPEGVDRRPAITNTVLRVIDQRSGAVLLEDIVNTNVSGTIPESFLVYHETLYYVKERKELVAVRLAGDGGQRQ